MALMGTSDWIALSALAVAGVGVGVAYLGLRVARLGHHLASDMAHRELLVEATGPMAKGQPVKVVIHNIGSRGETICSLLLHDGDRRTYAEPGDDRLLVPPHDSAQWPVNPEMVKHEWNDEVPRLGAGAHIEVRSLAGTVGRSKPLKAWLLVDPIAAARIEATEKT